MNTIQIGTQANIQCSIGGIFGITTGMNNAVPVLIDSTGQLGTISSSRKYKDNITDMDSSISSKILKLRPVTFTYKKHASQEGIHYGLIAEEVEEVIPNLVIYDANKEPQTVKYHELPILLLAHIQTLDAEVAKLKARVATLCAY